MWLSKEEKIICDVKLLSFTNYVRNLNDFVEYIIFLYKYFKFYLMLSLNQINTHMQLLKKIKCVNYLKKKKKTDFSSYIPIRAIYLYSYIFVHIAYFCNQTTNFLEYKFVNGLWFNSFLFINLPYSSLSTLLTSTKNIMHVEVHSLNSKMCNFFF